MEQALGGRQRCLGDGFLEHTGGPGVRGSGGKDVLRLPTSADGDASKAP